MQINLKLGPPFSEMMGNDSLSLDIEPEGITVGELLERLQVDYPDFDRKLRQNNLIREGKLYALVVLDGRVADVHSLPRDGSEIKLFFPLSGG